MSRAVKHIRICENIVSVVGGHGKDADFLRGENAGDLG